MKIAIRLSQKINSRIHNSRIAIRQRIAQLGTKVLWTHKYFGCDNLFDSSNHSLWEKQSIDIQKVIHIYRNCL